AIRLPDGRLVGWSAVCTHLSCAVLWREDDNLLECPCHDGVFDPATGEVVAGPPPRPLPPVELREENGGIWAVGGGGWAPRTPAPPPPPAPLDAGRGDRRHLGGGERLMATLDPGDPQAPGPPASGAPVHPGEPLEPTPGDRPGAPLPPGHPRHRD